jgi:PhnB protein
MQLSSQVNFDGKCKEAFKLYQQLLGGNIQTMMTWGESPMAAQMPSEFHDKIIHAALLVGNSILMGSDAPPDRYVAPRGFAVAIEIGDVSEAERVFGALSEKGSVTMPLQQTFWATRFGMLVDRFGIPWMVNCGNAA